MRYGVWMPGPFEKAGYAGLAVNACRGVICHSMVGATVHAVSRLNGSDRASWHFSVSKDGTVLQHYDSTAVCWHGGTRDVNGRYIGIEHEGGGPGNHGEPLTPAQLEASVKLVRELARVHGFPLDRNHLREHNEFYATACPSGRIPWDAYTEDHMPTPEFEALKETDDAIKKTLADFAIDANGRIEAQSRLLETLIPPLVKGTAAEAGMRWIWGAAGKAWPA